MDGNIGDSHSALIESMRNKSAENEKLLFDRSNQMGYHAIRRTNESVQVEKVRISTFRLRIILAGILLSAFILIDQLGLKVGDISAKTISNKITEDISLDKLPVDQVKDVLKQINTDKLMKLIQ